MRFDFSKNINIGVLAHVDAGKTTLSERLLFTAGVTRKLGRVDHGDAFFDFNALERARGITVYSKEARFSMGSKEFTLIDTPGHADLGAETERVLRVLDYAVLVVSATEGVQSHTVTLWRLLKSYGLPCFIFVNKTDSELAAVEDVLLELKELSADCMDFLRDGDVNYEDIAMISEKDMEAYLKKGKVSDENIVSAIKERRLFPVFFGSALKGVGIDEFIKFFAKYTVCREYREDFGARVYKITRDSKGVRLTHMKVTGGVLETKMPLLTMSDDGEGFEKVEQIRIYRGGRFDAVGQAAAGDIVAVTGLKSTYAGQGLGFEAECEAADIELVPALKHTVLIPDGEDSISMLEKLKEIEEEYPTLSVYSDEDTGEIYLNLMGDIEIDALKEKVKDRFDLDIDFGDGRIIYKETITGSALGIGHFEPLRHYAEVHLLLEPMLRGSGIVVETDISEDILRKSWQSLAAKYLSGRKHRGVLTGSEITDIKISLLGGKTHLKHTVGGDFRQATYRALRQGLRKALADGQVLLLEPMLSFTIELPRKYVGRVMTDIERLKGKATVMEETNASDGSSRKLSKSIATLKGEGPLATLRTYRRELRNFTGGEAIFSSFISGYGACHNQEEVVAEIGYDCDNDKYNPCGSVFTEQGSGVYVEWDMVDELAHFDSSGFFADYEDVEGDSAFRNAETGAIQGSADKIGATHGAGFGELEISGEGSMDNELRKIFEKTYGKSKRDAQAIKEAESKATMRKLLEQDNFPNPNPKSRQGAGESFLIIDAYNVMFAWEEFSELIRINIDAAKEAFIEIMMNYQGYKKAGITLVFDGYRQKGNIGTEQKYGNLTVIYTKEAQTADRYIEEYAFENGSKYDITVVSSDRLVQMSSYGSGTRRMSARELHEAVVSVSDEIREKLQRQRTDRNRPFEAAFEGNKQE